MYIRVYLVNHFRETISFLTQVAEVHLVASEQKDPICHSNECQIGSFSSEATIFSYSKSVAHLLLTP